MGKVVPRLIATTWYSISNMCEDDDEDKEIE